MRRKEPLILLVTKTNISSQCNKAHSVDVKRGCCLIEMLSILKPTTTGYYLKWKPLKLDDVIQSFTSEIVMNKRKKTICWNSKTPISI
jgi:hypothetical protein